MVRLIHPVHALASGTKSDDSSSLSLTPARSSLHVRYSAEKELRWIAAAASIEERGQFVSHRKTAADSAGVSHCDPFLSIPMRVI